MDVLSAQDLSHLKPYCRDRSFLRGGGSCLRFVCSFSGLLRSSSLPLWFLHFHSGSVPACFRRARLFSSPWLGPSGIRERAAIDQNPLISPFLSGYRVPDQFLHSARYVPVLENVCGSPDRRTCFMFQYVGVANRQAALW